MIAVVATLHGDRGCDFKLWQAPPEVDKHVILEWMVVFQPCVYKWVESGVWLASCSWVFRVADVFRSTNTTPTGFHLAVETICPPAPSRRGREVRREQGNISGFELKVGNF